MGRILVSTVLLLGLGFGQDVPPGHSNGEVTFPNQLPNLFELEPLTQRPLGSTEIVARRPGDEGRTIQRGPRREWVVLERPGSGMLVRIQSARRAGRLRIYLDGGEEPFLDEDLDDLLSGRVGWALAPFAAVHGGVGEMVFAIPHARRVLVTIDDPAAEVVLFHRRFAPGTTVRTVTVAERTEYEPETERLTRMMLDHRRFFLPMMQDFGKETHELPPGKETPFFAGKTEVGEAISWLSFECAAFTPAVLRRLVLVCRFDGVKTVEVPLGDFHGAWEAGVTFQSAAIGADDRGLLCSRWVMPYGKTATLSLRNTLDEAVTFEIGVGRLRRPFRETTRHFHATWRRGGTSRKGSVGTTVPLWGPGTLAGVALLWHMPTRWGFSEPQWTFHPAAQEPTTWPLSYILGAADTAAPFAEQLRGAPGRERKGMIGRTLAYRWMTLDALPFDGDATLSIRAKTIDADASLALVACWYAEPKAVAPLSPGALVVDEPVRPRPHRVIEGALEAERLLEVARTGRPTRVEAVRGASGDEVLRWEASANDSLTLRFAVPDSGPLALTLVVRGAPAGGRFAVAVDGKPWCEVHARGTGEEVSPQSPLSLAAGEHRITFRALADGGGSLDLDALRLTAN